MEVGQGEDKSGYGLPTFLLRLMKPRLGLYPTNFHSSDNDVVATPRSLMRHPKEFTAVNEKLALA